MPQCQDAAGGPELAQEAGVQRGHVHVERVLLDGGVDRVARPQRRHACSGLVRADAADLVGGGLERRHCLALVLAGDEHGGPPMQQRRFGEAGRRLLE